MIKNVSFGTTVFLQALGDKKAENFFKQHSQVFEEEIENLDSDNMIEDTVCFYIEKNNDKNPDDLTLGARVLNWQGATAYAGTATLALNQKNNIKAQDIHKLYETAFNKSAKIEKHPLNYFMV